ncbi:MAG: ferrous iron transport protein B [Deltaproteobacteria bacterium]|nr:ferrous iron transport protein B [Deltaproteobacteria bacterium]
MTNVTMASDRCRESGRKPPAADQLPRSLRFRYWEGMPRQSGTRRADLHVVERPSESAEPSRATRQRFHRIALVGNPNVGKSVIFGALTGTYATVSNYPGTTVEVTRAPARFDSTFEIIDTPGVNSLTPNSEDERVTRDIVLAGVDCVVQVADAKNLARALVVSIQLAEAGVPFVLVVNMMDEAADRGLSVDTGKLAAELGVPVVPTVAVTGHGLAAIAPAIARAAVSHARVRYPAVVERGLLRIERPLSGFHVATRWLSMMCLAGDDTLRQWLVEHVSAATLATIEDAHREVQQYLGTHVGYQLSRARVRAAEQMARASTRAAVVERPAVAVTSGREAALALAALTGCVGLFLGDLGLLPLLAEGWGRLGAWLAVAAAAIAAYRSAEMRTALGRWASARRTGPLVLLVVLYTVYRFVGVFAAGTAVDFFEETLFGGYLNPMLVGALDGLVALTDPSSDVARYVLHLVRDMLIGPYGVVTVALTYAFAIIFPIVTAFFLAFSVLEDSGYLPRLAVIVNRIFRGMGLNGKAVLPMILGLGCDTMATLTARIMETRKERVLVTLLLALGVPCSAQLGVILGLFGALPIWAPMVWGGVVLGVLFAVGFLAARLLPGQRSDLILELPPIRRPQLGNIVLKTVGRLEWYLKEAVPIFVLGTFVLFVLDATGALAKIVHASEPAVVGLLNLPPKAAEAFLVGFFRRDYGSAGIYALFQQGLLAPVQTVVALVTITLFVPCVANFFVIVKEHGLRLALAMSAFIFPFAFVVGAAVNVALRLAGLR